MGISHSLFTSKFLYGDAEPKLVLLMSRHQIQELIGVLSHPSQGRVLHIDVQGDQPNECFHASISCASGSGSIRQSKDKLIIKLSPNELPDAIDRLRRLAPAKSGALTYLDLIDGRDFDLLVQKKE